VVSEQPLLYVRGGNSGGYDALMVFSKNFWQLLTKCRQFGYSQKAVEAAYQNSLAVIIPGVIEVWPLRAGGLCDLFWHTRNHAILYTKFIPLLARRFKKYLSDWPYRMCWGLARRMVRSFAARFGAEMHAVVQEVSEGGASKQFQLQVVGAHPGACVRHPIYLKNPKYFEIGMGFVAQPGLRIEAWDQYGGEKFRPMIKIGHRVSLNWNVHIGAIDRIEIGDDVLIGSNVLITDHFHGSAADLALTPASRPLKSKGPVIIEANVLIGEGVCILPNVRIGKGAVIGANAVVTADVPAGAVMGGVPARIINRPEAGLPAARV
jgi:acetyltransferase-like isoleucine patch superfamily enzyme